MIEVITPGPLTLLEDLGRPGLGGMGVSRSGAVDRGALRLANRLVGNDEGAAGFEVTLGGLSVQFHRRATVAVTGAEGPVHVDGIAAGMNGPLTVGPGSMLVLGTPTSGLRTYVAVRGGIDAVPVLGSRSTDVLSGLGPPFVAPGDRFSFGDAACAYPVVDVAPVRGPSPAPTLDLLLATAGGEWFAPQEVDALRTERYVVTPHSNRVALRLAGRPLRRSREGELPPQGLVPGAVQIPPDGQPVVFLADHPVTGGYPVIGVLTSRSVRAAAQSRPGDIVRLRPCACPRGSGSDAITP